MHAFRALRKKGGKKIDERLQICQPARLKSMPTFLLRLERTIFEGPSASLPLQFSSDHGPFSSRRGRGKRRAVSQAAWVGSARGARQHQ